MHAAVYFEDSTASSDAPHTGHVQRVPQNACGPKQHDRRAALSDKPLCSLANAEFSVRYIGPKGPRVLVSHGTGTQRRFRPACLADGCKRRAQKGNSTHTGYCVRHGGGKRCAHSGCTTGAYSAYSMCIKHGGGPRCQLADRHHGLPPYAPKVLTATAADADGLLHPHLAGLRACYTCFKAFSF